MSQSSEGDGPQQPGGAPADAGPATGGPWGIDSPGDGVGHGPGGRDAVSVTEGDLPPGVRPLPGRRRSHRQIWLGNRDGEGPEGAADRKWTEEEVFSYVAPKGRVIGLDAARGFALIGMVAVHTLPSWSPQNYQPTLLWDLFAGHAAALFAVLAGITLAILSGGPRPNIGPELSRSRVQIAVRALVIMTIGMGVNFLDFPAYNILPYYGLMFLAAIPFLGFRIRYLLAMALGSSLVGPVLAYFVNSGLDYQPNFNINLVDPFLDAPVTLLSLFFGGTYPLAEWMPFIFLGMALGRMRLTGIDVQIKLGLAGLILTGFAFFSSDTLLNFFGGWDRLLNATPGMTGADLFDILDYGPPDGEHLPATTLWWLTINAPHAGTSFSIFASAGMAVLAISIFLLAVRVYPVVLGPLMDAGTMTLTMYVSHLLFLAFVDFNAHPGVWFAVQLIAMLVFAYFWRTANTRGPLEAIVSRVVKRVGKLPSREEAGSSVGADKP